MVKPILRKFKSIQARKASADGLKKSVKQYESYILYADGTDSALIPKILAEWLIKNDVVDYRDGKDGE